MEQKPILPSLIAHLPSTYIQPSLFGLTTIMGTVITALKDQTRNDEM